MGNRSHLYVTREGKDEILFEANSSLPFFWIGLLDQQTLADCKTRWEAYESLTMSEEEVSGETWPGTDLLIPRDTALYNLESMNALLQSHYPHTSSLFDDFRDYLSRQLCSPEDRDGLDLIQLGNFTTVGGLWEGLERQVRQIRENRGDQLGDVFYRDLIGNDTGFFSGRGSWDSIVYQQAMREREKPVKPVLRSQKKFNALLLVLYIATLLLCPFLRTWPIE